MVQSNEYRRYIFENSVKSPTDILDMRIFIKTHRLSCVLLAICLCTAVCFVLLTDLSAARDSAFFQVTSDPEQPDWGDVDMDSREVEDLDFLKFLRESKQENQIRNTQTDRNQTGMFRYNFVLI